MLCIELNASRNRYHGPGADHRRDFLHSSFAVSLWLLSIGRRSQYPSRTFNRVSWKLAPLIEPIPICGAPAAPEMATAFPKSKWGFSFSHSRVGWYFTSGLPQKCLEKRKKPQSRPRRSVSDEASVSLGVNMLTAHRRFGRPRGGTWRPQRPPVSVARSCRSELAKRIRRASVMSSRQTPVDRAALPLVTRQR